jgi:hypothetical protein
MKEPLFAFGRERRASALRKSTTNSGALEVAEESSCFEGARLQPRRKHSSVITALAAEGMSCGGSRLFQHPLQLPGSLIADSQHRSATSGKASLNLFFAFSAQKTHVKPQKHLTLY